jgi:hypothetical protein
VGVDKPPPRTPDTSAAGDAPQGDPRGLQIWHRIQADAVRLGLDPRTATEITKLGLTGDLTSGPSMLDRLAVPVETMSPW